MRKIHLLIILLWLSVCAFTLPRIDLFASNNMDPYSGDGPVFLKILGEGRSMVSALSLLQADLYFHRGVSQEHEGSARDDLMGHELLSDGDADPHSSINENFFAKNGFGLLFRISDEIEATDHVHLEGTQIKEMMPWLYYAAATDPRNVSAYTLAGFYLANRLDRPYEGISFLKQGLTKNPRSWEINAEIGRIYCVNLQKYETALRFLLRAHKFQEDASDSKFDERNVLSLMGMCYEHLDHPEKAVAIYRTIADLFPEDEKIKDKIKKLQALDMS